MSYLLELFEKNVQYVSAMGAPLDLDGAPTLGLSGPRRKDIHDLIEKPSFELSDLGAYWDALKNINGVGLDDRQLLLEKVLILMAGLSNDPKLSKLSQKIQELVITMLYKDLPHPPSSYLSILPNQVPEAATLSPSVNYAFRSADGSNYNPLYPTLGKAGSPYARSVASINATPISCLPDPGLVFDTLLRRDKGAFTPHPGGVSSLFFAFADLVIHSIFNTNHTDWKINDTSSYLDLSILYGNSEIEQRSVRKQDGTGQLYNDVFADSRLLHMPPASCALLVLLNRNHNYIAQKILDINENRNFVKPPPKHEAARKAQDDELFHRARLVNCAYFMQIILGDYVGAILGLTRDGYDWRLDPLMAIRELNHDIAPRGDGNVVSVEFNLLYRWHPTLSETDDKWITNVLTQAFEGKDPSKATVEEFKQAAHAKMIPPSDVKVWTFDGLKRNSDGRFDDGDLAKVLQDSTENRAGAFKARGIPEALRVIEIMAIEQSRSWGTCSMNEFRKFLGLKPYTTFKEWNPDPAIHTAAAALYDSIDNLELHVGLQAEQAKSPGPGAGLCPGYTISRAILADAVSLSRGDRYMTVEFTPHSLTSWGYQDCQYDKNDGSYGGMLTKLLFRTLPDHYPVGSAYAHFPFLDPVYMREKLITANNPIVNNYAWTRPRQHAPTQVIDTYAGVKQVISHPSFMSAYDEKCFTVTKPILRLEGKGDAEVEAAEKGLLQGRSLVTDLLVHTSKHGLGEYFSNLTLELVEESKFDHVNGGSKYVDIVKHVINMLPIYWISQEIIGLPLKTKTNPRGIWYGSDVYEKFVDLSSYIYLDFNEENDWRLRESSQGICKDIAKYIRGHLERIESLVSISDTHNHMSIQGYHSHKFLKLVMEASRKESLHELAAQVFTAVIPTTAIYSQAITNTVDFFLREENRDAREEIAKLARSGLKDNGSKIMTYIREALRLKPPVSSIYRVAAENVPRTISPQSINVQERVFADIPKANLDPAIFGSEARSAKYNRSSDSHQPIINGINHGMLAPTFFESTVPFIVGTILGLKNIRRGPGRSGHLNEFNEVINGVNSERFINQRGIVIPCANSLIVEFD